MLYVFILTLDPRLVIVKTIAIIEHDNNEPFVFSMASSKLVVLNEFLLRKLFKSLIWN
jgi:hypothetical protein